MRIFGVGSSEAAQTAIGTSTATSAPTVRTRSIHPSAPIPVQGAPIGEALRVPLGESGLSVFPLILGGAEFGWNVDIAASHSILDRYRAFGGNIVHTADSHASGRSEHIIGRWITTRSARDDIVVATRVAGSVDHPGLGSVNLVRAVEASLQRLETDRIDLLYLDGGADLRTPLDETLATAEWLVESGKVRAVGAFGFTPERLVEARILSSAGYPHLTVLDAPYNVLRRKDFEGDLRLVAGAQGMAVTPSHALQHGFLSGRYRSRPRKGDNTGVRRAQAVGSLNRRGNRILRALDTVAGDVDVPPAAVAVAWLLAQKPVVAPIVNVFAPDQVDELVRGIGVRLSRAQLSELARAAE
ncbi:MAG: aldo/keto reductase [Microbacterium sp.]|uniref:aldo/keto reductase n=1 Tax=Microbacterium sp. TaxID=51671 RepID=UPI003A8C4319